MSRQRRRWVPTDQKVTIEWPKKLLWLVRTYILQFMTVGKFYELVIIQPGKLIFVVHECLISLSCNRVEHIKLHVDNSLHCWSNIECVCVPITTFFYFVMFVHTAEKVVIWLKNCWNISELLLLELVFLICSKSMFHILRIFWYIA